MTVNVIGGTAAVACLYGFARAAFGRTTAFAAAAILTVHPYAIKFCGDVQSEGLYLGLFLGAVWALWLALRNASLGAAFVAGLLCGLAYLTRPEGIGLLAVGGALAAWNVVRGSWSRRRAAVWGALLFLTTASVAGPYVGWIRAETGVWSLTQKKSVGWVTGLSGPPARFAPKEEAAPAEPDRTAMPAPTPAKSTAEPQRPDSVVRGISRYRIALVDLIHTNLQALGPELFAILLAGGLIGRWKRLSLRGVFVLTVVGLYGLLLFQLTLNVGYVSTRHALRTGGGRLGARGSGSPRAVRRIFRIEEESRPRAHPRSRSRASASRGPCARTGPTRLPSDGRPSGWSHRPASGRGGRSQAPHRLLRRRSRREDPRQAAEERDREDAEVGRGVSDHQR